MMVFPSVDFPQPDSPTTPIISPLFTDRETLSKAFNQPVCRFQELFTGNHLEKFFISKIGSPVEISTPPKLLFTLSDDIFCFLSRR